MTGSEKFYEALQEKGWYYMEDKPEYSTARRFIRQFVVGQSNGDLDHVEPSVPDPVVDFKSALQELAQVRKLPQPRYVIVSERGPEHSKTFTVEVRVGKEWSGQAEGFTKKAAAQRAAREVYERLLAPAPQPSV